MTRADWGCAILGAVGVMLILLAPLAKRTDGYQTPLDPLSSAPYADREVSRHEARYNENPRKSVIKSGLCFIGAAIWMELGFGSWSLLNLLN